MNNARGVWITSDLRNTPGLLWGIMFGLVAVRLALMIGLPYELIPDEAYYWDWSRQPAWGYYSKPPLVAWLIGAMTGLFGHETWAIRLPATVCCSLGLWPIFHLTRRAYSVRAAWLAVAALIAMPGTAAAGLLMTIDAPFLFAWAGTLYVLWRLIHSPEDDWSLVPGAMAVTMFGLLAKQTMLGCFPLLLIYLAGSPIHRRRWRDLRLWVWSLGSLSALIPVMLWNQEHGWPTLQHTREHFQSPPVSVIQHVVWGMELLGSQFGVVSPITCGLFLSAGAMACWGFLRRAAVEPEISPAGDREWFLLAFSLVPLVPVLVLGFLQRVQPNWPAPFYCAGIVLTAGWADRQWAGQVAVASWRAWMPRGIAVGLVLAVLTSAVPVLLPRSPLAGTRLDPTARLRGWHSLAVQFDAVRQGDSNSAEMLVIAATSRTLVSELAYYLPDHPRVYRWNTKEVIDSQHELWPDPSAAGNPDAWIVTHAGQSVPQKLKNAFTTMEPAGAMRVMLGNGREEAYDVWKGTTLTKWPDYRFENAASSPLRLAGKEH